ncbi:I78 family peptidase inhibitor [Pseudomonas sp. McL0111]|uniref:I78 family peptidase inhibitor n=1 Tax=Pseudomonas sp. McL0111 TaxID=3457357 RepID=UPI00403E823D
MTTMTVSKLIKGALFTVLLASTLPALAGQCNIDVPGLPVGQKATSLTLSAIQVATGSDRLRLEKPEDMFSLLNRTDRVRVLVNDRDEILEIICG